VAVTAEERIISPVSAAELRRRWAGTTAFMEHRGIDALLIRATNDYLGGYVRWFTDLPASTGFPVTLVFPRGGGMSCVAQGQFGLDRSLDGEDPVYRGVTRLLGAPGYASVAHTGTYEIEAVIRALEPYSGRTVGVIGPANLPYALADRMRSGVLGALQLVDATEWVDAIKCVKSAEERNFIRRTAELQDRCMQAVVEEIRPGMTDIEVSAIAQRAALAQGSEQGVYLVGSAAVGSPAAYGIRHFQGRVIREGDYLNVLIEANGPGGFYTELGRMIALGEPGDELRREMEFVERAQDFAVDALKPGTACADIWTRYNDFVRSHGRPEERRLFSHGQGYDLVERPLVRHDETMTVAAGMNFSCHPTFASERHFCTACDNYLVGEHGAERIHRFPRGIVAIG
jgi:Xaa-Pro aminopeptidase